MVYNGVVLNKGWRKPMMSTTEFGKYLRLLRVQHGEVLADAKLFLGVSTSFISAVELGKKLIPSDWFEKIVTHYKLEGEQINELKATIERSKKEIKFDIEFATPEQKDLTIQFQRSFKDLDDETIKEMKRILERNKQH